MSELDTQIEEEVVEAVEVEESPKSMDDTIRETYEAIQSRGEETEEEAEARERDERGRFKASQKAPEAPVEEPVAVTAATPPFGTKVAATGAMPTPRSSFARVISIS